MAGFSVCRLFSFTTNAVSFIIKVTDYLERTDRMTAKKKGFGRLISWMFLMYFVILFGERAQSLFRAITQYGLFPSAFDDFVNLTAILSLCATVAMLVIRCRSFWKSLFSAAEADYCPLSVTSGVILVSGMLHTEFTIAPIQFAAYGMLIIAMILRSVELSGIAQNRFSLWYSLGYLTAFSMAIPVVYHSEIESAVLFHVIESAVMLLLVLSFTLMLRRLFLGKGENLLLWVPFIIMAVGDAVVLWMRWAEEINSFVLIFACLSAVLFIIGKVISGIKR